MWFIILALALQIYFGIHAVKTGRPFVWVLVIILTSVFGCAAYVIIELLPEWLASSKGDKFKKTVSSKIDPEKDLKAAQQACEQLDTAKNRLELAEQYLKLNRHQEARDVYARSLTGIYAEDPQFLLGLAKAEFGLDNFAEAIAALDKLKATNPDFKSPEGHLLYARALENTGQTPEAIHEYEVLGKYYPTPEPICRLAQIYKKQGDKERAVELFKSVIHRSATAGNLFNETNKDWIKLAKSEVGAG